ncbi:MAG: sugar ABC transporter permease [Anaerolineae bacterium]|nr:sugar ABC transporter permease [Anaerolineae bacterium]
MFESFQKLFATRRGRALRENFTAYLFILPATAIIFVFGLFPVAFAFFVSLWKWRRFPDEYRGMENYIKALGDFSYVLFMAIAIGVIFYAGFTLRKMWRRTDGKRKVWLLLIPGLLNAIASATFVYWFFLVLPYILEAPRRVPRGRAGSRQAFLDEFFNSFSFPEVTDAAHMMLIAFGIALVVSVIILLRTTITDRALYVVQFTFIGLLLIAAVSLIYLDVDAINQAADAARAAGEDLPVWSYMVLIGGGVVVLGVAYRLWRYAVRQHNDRRFILSASAAIMLLIGAYLLIVQIPQALTEADDDLVQGFWVTVLYVIGTVPPQLLLGLFFAYRLFHIARGKSIFRMLYFLPYITPFAATAVVFATLFSNRPLSIANRAISMFGLDAQKWLSEPTPIYELIFNTDLPRWLEGPSLALVVIMLWSTWTYMGYDIVIFLAGLGNISPEYYEAAQIDGASGWHIFRHITLPLLSPTTFFLSLIAIIGTFQAFTQIWMMRQPAAYDAVDTVGVYLFTEVRTNNNLGYGSALAFVLFGVILIVTFFQNRIMGREVFYG